MSASRPRVLLVYPLSDARGEERIAEYAEVIRGSGDDSESILRDLKDVDAVVLRGPAHLTAEHISANPQLQVIACLGAGTDHIDIEAATRAGIPVLHNAGVAQRSVAEYVLGAMIAAHRGLFVRHQALLAGSLDWSSRLSALTGTELTGTTVGIVGYGHIGRHLARMASAALDARVLTYDPYLPVDADLGPAARVDDLGALLDESLTVSINVALTDETRNMISTSELERIGPNGVLINTSRGGVVDAGAVVAQLRAGRLKAAVLDVLPSEPPREEDLEQFRDVPNLIVTPHIAGVTDQAAELLSMAVADSVLLALNHERLPRVANPELFGG